MTTVTAPPEPAAQAGVPVETLVEQNACLSKQIDTLNKQNDYLSGQNEWLKQQLGLIKQKVYGPSSEAARETQPSLLFNEAEELSVPVAEPELETVTIRIRRKGKRAADLAGLPVETIRHELPAAEQQCAHCCGPLHEIGSDERQEIKIVPATVTVVRHLRIKYACRDCERHGTGSAVVGAALPRPAFAGSLASPSAVAFIISQKYDLSLPLYRQEQYLQGLGIALSRQTMANWVLRGAELLKPLVNRMQSLLLSREILHADETRVQVLQESERDATTQSFMWVYRSGRDGPPLVLYDYQISRAALHPQRYLKEFRGYLHADGYSGYANLPGVTVVGCWAHVRRKFEETLRALPAGSRSSGEPAIARQGLDFCNKLFKIESDVKTATIEQRLQMRREQCLPLLENFEQGLAHQEPRVLPQSLLGRAVGYARNQWPKLLVFLEDGRLEIDNNRCERSVKPFVIGRKNWLFANTPKGANASALIYSIVITAKENGLRPAAYLQYLFETLPYLDQSDDAMIDTLLPWMPDVQNACK